MKRIDFQTCAAEKKNKELPMLKKSKTETMYSFTDNPDWWVIVTEQENARPFVSVRCRDTRVVEMYHETSVKALEWANQEIKEYIEFCKKMGVSFF